MSDIRLIKPVKVSTLHAKAKRYREGFVDLFREYEGAQVITEDGELMTNAKGRQFVTARWFAREMGIPVSTFHLWINGTKQSAPDILPDHEQMDESDDLGAGSEVGTRPTCSCIPDPGCPIHGEGVNHGSPLENRYA